MRNLRYNHHSAIQSPTGRRCTSCAWDVESDSVVCTFGPAKDNDLIELKRWRRCTNTFENIVSWQAPCPSPDIECDEVLDLHYFADTCTAVLVLAGGDLVIVREDPRTALGEDQIEIVGSVDAGIAAASWSADEELLALATKASTFLYMTRNFENIVDFALTEDDLKASDHVSVGWGKKETQFKGKKARALKDPTIPENVDEGLLHSSDSRRSTISWRGDGAYVALNSIVSTYRRAIRVFSREGVLESISEPTNYLTGAVAWRPAGNIIASIQILETGPKVLFFEKNGLRHGEFYLRLGPAEATNLANQIELKWNVDSSVLAVCCASYVQLWTMGNYHYYLKQLIRLSSEDYASLVPQLQWHPEKALQLVIGSAVGVQRSSLASISSLGPTLPPDDDGIVAVIDGRILKLTALRYANVPPPASQQELHVDSEIIDVAVYCRRTTTPATYLAVLDHDSISLFKWDLQGIKNQIPTLVWKSSFIREGDRLAQMNFQVTIGQKMRISVLQRTNSSSQIRLFDHQGRERTKGAVQLEGIWDEVLIQRAVGPCAETNIIISDQEDSQSQPLDGQISIIRGLHGLIVEAALHAIDVSKSSHGMSNGTLDSLDHTPTNNTPSSQNILFALDERGVLYANSHPLVKSCTSFIITDAHLIYTTNRHLLKFVHLDSYDPRLLKVPPDTPESDERCRSIERGAKIVTVVPTSFSLVLQMPRGNLETIYPRALVLTGIRASIRNKKYREAFYSCRNHRVDMNLLYDYAPSQFSENTKLFVSELGKAGNIDLFLSQLKEEDVSKSMYQETLATAEEQVLLAEEDVADQGSDLFKVNRICDAVLSVLSDVSAANIQNIISAHVCKTPPDLEAGLNHISRLRKTSSEHVDTAVEHICFLADVNKLYDNALGLYDLQTALLIAQQSQKDPREYIPFLQGLQDQSEIKRQFQIDDHLGRHEKALHHLSQSDSLDRVLKYVEKHQLYQVALQIYRYDEAKLCEVLRAHATFLQSEGRHKEAGCACEYLKDFSLASESFRQAHLWKESLSCAGLAGFDKPQLDKLAISLSHDCMETNDFWSAATINLDYLNDVASALRAFCKGFYFADAIRIACLRSQTSLLGEIIDPGLAESMASILELLAECKAQLNSQVPRIQELRKKKADDPLSYLDGDGAGGSNIPDDISVAGTDASTVGGSLFTRYTNRSGTVGTNATRRTSKNRRREERKRAKGKKGSIYEEEYLVNSVRRLIERVNSTNDDVSRLVVGLMRRTMRERARAVDAAMADMVSHCERAAEEVFGRSRKDKQRESRTENGLAQQIENGEMVDMDSLQAQQRAQEPPAVKAFSRLSIASF